MVVFFCAAFHIDIALALKRRSKKIKIKMVYELYCHVYLILVHAARAQCDVATCSMTSEYMSAANCAKTCFNIDGWLLRGGGLLLVLLI